MARYFFDWRENGIFVQDYVGVDCVDLDVVTAEALKAVRDGSRDMAPNSARRVMAVEVRDASSNLILRARLVLELQVVSSQ